MESQSASDTKSADISSCRSPVFRDALNIGDRTLGSNAATPSADRLKDPIEIGASIEGIKWLFGLMEGSSLDDLGLPEKRKADQPFSSRPVHEARGLADRYDIAFFDGILAQALFAVASETRGHAAAVIGIGCEMKNAPLCRYATQYLAPYSSPPYMDADVIQAIGVGGECAIMRAFYQSFCTCAHSGTHTCLKTQWTGKAEQWMHISRVMKFPHI